MPPALIALILLSALMNYRNQVELMSGFQTALIALQFLCVLGARESQRRSIALVFGAFWLVFGFVDMALSF